MRLHVCLGCPVAYPAGIPACPQCGAKSRGAVYGWGDDVAREAGVFWVTPGEDPPAGLPVGVRVAGSTPPRPRGRPRKPEPALT
jgi:hypothetical protein